MSISDLFRAQMPPVSGASSPSREALNRSATNPAPPSGPSEFEKVLNQQSVKLSQHAETRIKSREIPWDALLEKRISGGLDSAQAKGSREALILADNVAVIANVKSRTIITAMDREELKDRIFTNIDSAVLV